MKKVLVVEDETAIREFEVINLKRGGYTVVEAANGEEALQIFNSQPDIDIALLDITMPQMDGFTLCKELRKRTETLGIIILTARTQEMDKVNGLMLGADDYVTKPFSPSELLARVDSLYRRVEMQHGKPSNSNEMRCGQFALDLIHRTLYKNGVNIELTSVEFQIMEYLFSKPNTPVERADILKYVWGSNYYGDEKIVDVNIRRLRMKIEDTPSHPKYLLTVWGMGYKWSTDN